MKFNKIITVVVLALSFCVFDQMKDNLVEKVSAPGVNHEILMGSVEKIHDMVPENFIRTRIIHCEEDGGDKNNGFISVYLGEKVCKAILLSKF